jgi:iron complex outermembrane receptor protein
LSCDVTGNGLPFSPKLKVNIGADRQFALGKVGSVRLSGNFAYNSGYFSEPDNVVRQQEFATLDISVEWRATPRSPLVRIWARNLTDARYDESLVTFPTAGVLHRPAAPRRLGASVQYDL